MKGICAEVEFQSTTRAYRLEKSGVKNHIERLIATKDAEWLGEHKVRTIRITKADDPTLSFTREITNIVEEGEILGHYLYSFTWKHEVRK